MQWRRLVASVAVIAAAAGCQAEDPVPGVGGAGPAVPRLQKPEAESAMPSGPITLLNMTPEQAGDARAVATIRATVNNVPIFEQEIRSTGASSPEEVRKVLDVLIDRELVLQDAKTRFSKGNGSKFLEKLQEVSAKEFDKQVVRGTKKRLNLKTDDDFKNWLRAQGMSLDMLRRQFDRQFMQQQYLLFLIGPKLDRIGHEQIVEYYQKHPEEFEVADGVQWQDLFVAASSYPSREEAHRFAEQLVTRIRGGEDFGPLATRYDNGYSSYNNGQGNGKQRGQIQPREAEPYLFQMKDGEVALIELSGGYHVIRLVKREFAGTKPFDEQTQSAIREKLRNEVFTRESKQIIADLRSKATIEIANPAP